MRKEFDAADPRFGFGAMLGKKAVEGVQIVGAYAPQGFAAATALSQPVTGLGSNGETVSDRYQDDLAQEKAASELFKREHPYASFISGQAGDAAAKAALSRVPVVGPILATPAGPAAARALRGAVTGGALGAADARARGESVGRGAAWGALTGAAEAVVKPMLPSPKDAAEWVSSRLPAPAINATRLPLAAPLPFAFAPQLGPSAQTAPSAMLPPAAPPAALDAVNPPSGYLGLLDQGYGLRPPITLSRLLQPASLSGAQ